MEPCKVRCTGWALFIPCVLWSECGVVPCDGWQCLCVTWTSLHLSTPTERHYNITSSITGQTDNSDHPSLTARLSKHKICDQLFIPKRKFLIKGKIFTRQQVWREEIENRAENILLLSAKDDESQRPKKQERSKQSKSFDVCCIFRMILLLQ